MAIHLSGPPGGGTPEGAPDGPSVPLFDLAPGGVYRADRVTPVAGALLPHRFTLTCALPGGIAIGGLFSVALSCRSPRLAVSQHPALWSPDLPRPVPPGGVTPAGTGRDHPAGSPSPPSSHSTVAVPDHPHAGSAGSGHSGGSNLAPCPSVPHDRAGLVGARAARPRRAFHHRALQPGRPRPPVGRSPRRSGSPGRSGRSRSCPRATASSTWSTRPTPGTAERPCST